MKKLFYNSTFTRRKWIYAGVLLIATILLFLREEYPNVPIGNLPIVIVMIINVIMLFELLYFHSNRIEITEDSITASFYIMKKDLKIDLNEVIHQTIRFDEVESLEKIELTKYANEGKIPAFKITTKENYHFCLFINNLKEDKSKFIEEKLTQHIKNT